jgi:acyl dehydratase/NADP-dependent 3-hydroxy acid dehydrogenase YdfG
MQKFDRQITNKDRYKFAELSGDWNPLHTSDVYAKKTEYKECILHGAFSAGLFSKMAGMVLPGESCLLHGMQLKFIRPISTPMTVSIIGEVIRDNGVVGEVKCKIENKATGDLLVEGAYQFARREFKKEEKVLNFESEKNIELGDSKNNINTIVTGSSGSMGAAVLRQLGNQCITLKTQDLFELDNKEIMGKIKNINLCNIVHCGWPKPNNVKLTNLTDPKTSIAEQISSPLEQIIRLANLMKKNGKENGCLVLIGSTYSNPGSHGWKFPLYSLSKGMLLNLTKILALELAYKGIRVVGLSLDVIHGGMNQSMTAIAQQMNVDRTLTGELPLMKEVAEQIQWILNNPSRLISGSFIDFSGGAQP